MNITSIPKIKHTGNNNFFLIAGPCVVENEQVVFETASTLKSITDELQIPFIFKASYRKANRTSAKSFTGIGDEDALQLLKRVGDELKIPVITDIHESYEASLAAQYVDVLQIPAFLFRQTDLLLAAAATGKWINIKKGQFAAANAMQFALDKVRSAGNNNVMATDRGNIFGYSDLVVDYRNLVWMKNYNAPVVMDCTHSLQIPNQPKGVTGGMPELIETIAKAAIAVGADGLFIETHPNPTKALSDGANMLPLIEMKPLLEKLMRIRKAIAD